MSHLSHMALALNPNLTEAQFMEATKLLLESRQHTLDLFCSHAEKILKDESLTPIQRIESFNRFWALCAPLVF